MHEEQVVNGSRNPPPDAHAQLIPGRCGHQSFAHQDIGLVDVAHIEHFQLGLDVGFQRAPCRLPRPIRSVEERSLTQIERPCIQGTDVRAQPQHFQAVRSVLPRQVVAACGEIHKHRAGRPDALHGFTEQVKSGRCLPGVGFADVDMHDGGPGGVCLNRAVRDFLGRVGNCGIHVLGWLRTDQGSRNDDRCHGTELPCRFGMGVAAVTGRALDCAVGQAALF